MVCGPRTLKSSSMIMGFRWLFFWLICGGLYTSQGTVDLFSSNYKDLDLDAQLKILNKSPVQSFQKEDGSIIDCIDIYKQPAFDHPLLKNHKLQMRLSSLLQEKIATSLLDQFKEEDEIIQRNSKSKFPGCPSGTVPIRRTRKEDLIRANSALRYYLPIPKDVPNVTPPDGVHYAGISTPEGTSNQYFGTSVTLSVHNLTMLVPKQTSSASARVGTEVYGPFTSVEFGSTVNQELYGDSSLRTFGLWTADGFEKTGCFNMLCPGFVQVSRYHILGDKITDLTGKDLKFMYFNIAKDPETHHWWLVQSLPREETNVSVGYWPKELFSDFEFATNVQVGGKVFNPPLAPDKAPMGSGHFDPTDFLRTASAIFALFNSSHGSTLDSPEMVVTADVPDSYQSQYLYGTTVIYGGPDIQNTTLHK